jgi:hypothetical protein
MSTPYHNQYKQNLQNKINFLNKLEKSGTVKTFNFNDVGFRNTFYNDHENGLVGSRPNRPSDYTTQTQRITNSQKIINTSNQYLQSASKNLSKSSTKNLSKSNKKK